MSQNKIFEKNNARTRKSLYHRKVNHIQVVVFYHWVKLFPFLGLYYNKLSGSCDYSTNVICKAPVTSTFKPFLASGTSLATRSPTTTSEPFLDYVDFSSEEKDIFDDSEEVVKSKEITRSEEDSETELEKLLDLIHELGKYNFGYLLIIFFFMSSSHFITFLFYYLFCFFHFNILFLY